MQDNTGAGSANDVPDVIDAFQFFGFTIAAKPDAAGAFEVKSDSGSVYTISRQGSADGISDDGAVWACSCPGYSHRGKCKHLTAFKETNMGGE